MLEQLPLLLATPIATAILNKFYEGVGSELAKKSVNDLPAAVKTKIQALGQFVWEKCLKRSKDPARAEKLLQDAAAGSEAAQTTLSEGLNQVIANDSAFEQQVKELAADLHQEINIGQMSGGEVWNVFGGTAKKEVFTDNKAPIIKDVTGSTINITYGSVPIND